APEGPPCRECALLGHLPGGGAGRGAGPVRATAAVSPLDGGGEARRAAPRWTLGGGRVQRPGYPPPTGAGTGEGLCPRGPPPAPPHACLPAHWLRQARVGLGG